MGDFLPGGRSWRGVRWWQLAVALIAVTVLVVSGVHWYAAPRTVTERPAAGAGVGRPKVRRCRGRGVSNLCDRAGGRVRLHRCPAVRGPAG